MRRAVRRRKSLLIISSDKKYQERLSRETQKAFREIRILPATLLVRECGIFPPFEEPAITVVDLAGPGMSKEHFRMVSDALGVLASQHHDTYFLAALDKAHARTLMHLYAMGVHECFFPVDNRRALNSRLRAIASEPTPPLARRSVSWSPALLEISSAIGSTLELPQLLQKILDLTLEELEADQGSILLLEFPKATLKMLASRGLPRSVVKRGYIERKGSIAEWVIRHDRPLLLKRKVEHKAFSSIAGRRRITSSMCVPLRAKGKIIGTININRVKSARQFGPRDLDALVIMASQAAIAIENARLIEERIQRERLALVGQTVAGITHCIKNIMTGVKGSLFVCEKALQSGNREAISHSWTILKRSVNRISGLALDMLDYVKQKKPVLRKTELDTVVDEVFDTADLHPERGEVRLVSSILPDIGPLYVDSDHLYRCLLNLVNNAVDACGSSGEVRVEARKVAVPMSKLPQFRLSGYDTVLVITVSDTGSGIPPKQLKTVFEPFFSTKGSHGTGLGLAVTKKLVEEHWGKIFVQSGPKTGTTFTIVLPFLDQPPESAE
jgi:signal transduction histidine kinase